MYVAAIASQFWIGMLPKRIPISSMDRGTVGFPVISSVLDNTAGSVPGRSMRTKPTNVDVTPAFKNTFRH